MIRVLPAEIVNQIAAGEVVERPFSVVKELVENSLDAGARRLHVAISDGGRAAIRIIDDGAGFSEEDLALAFIGHATSKLACVEDLDHIASLGFRGEALASIGSVARALIKSRTRDGDAGFEIGCEGGALGEVRPCACPPGTTVEIRDLFFNTPARRRFLKTPRAERGRIQDLLLRLAIARPDVDVTLEVDGREVLRLPATEDLRDRVGRAFGRSVAAGLRPVELQWGDLRVTGLTGVPDLARRDTSLELIYVNGRLARDKSSTFAVRQAYREHLIGGRYPVCFLMLQMPPDQVDVNVHPTKSEVRFLDGRRVSALLHDAVRAALATERPGAAAEAQLSVGADKPRASSGFPSLTRDLFEVSEPRPVRVGENPPGSSFTAPSPRVRPHPFEGAGSQRFLQVSELYLVFEGPGGGLVVVDQHALHERVLYERLMREHADGGEVRVQRLVVPEVVELSGVDKAWLLDARETLAYEGLLIDDFGGDAIAVAGVPAVLDRVPPRALIESLLEDSASAARPRAEEAIRERFHSRACRSAIMRGDPLTQDEIAALLREASELEHPHNCPHGRPTTINFEAAELERFFRRRV